MVGWALVAGQGVLLVLLVVLPRGTAWTVPAALAVVLLVLTVVGLAIAGLGLAGLGDSLSAHPEPLASGSLRTEGVYRFVRHPVYTGLLVAAASVTARSGSVAVVVVLVVLVVLLAGKAWWEESLLREQHPQYADYAARTGRFVPKLPRRRDRG